MKRKETHVVPAGEKGWAIEKENATRVTGYCPTKEEAVRRGREISRNQGTELIIHGRDGRIQKADSHGNDPCPPRDKN